MREGPLSYKYIKVEDRIGHMVREDISLDHMTEAGAMIQIATQNRIIEVIDLGKILEEIVDRIIEKGTEMKGMVNNNNRDKNRSRERTFVGNYRRDRSSSNDRSRSGSRTSMKRDRIRCYTCREYDHFERDCP